MPPDTFQLYITPAMFARIQDVLGVSQRRYATILGISQSAVSRAIRGRPVPRRAAEVLNAIARSSADPGPLVLACITGQPIPQTPPTTEGAHS